MKHWGVSEWVIAVGAALAVLVAVLYFAGVTVRLDFPAPAETAPATSEAAS